ncbi:MAG: hypothetical protein JJU10_01485 [Idiomarina sp.]|nr:hypothetical protein [Idiomarina sp.]
MGKLKRFRVRVSAFVLAVLGASLLGTLVQTQLNLHAIATIGPPISLSERFATTWHDLFNFAPLLIALMVLTFVVAIPIAHGISHFQKRQFTAWCMVAGGVGLWTMFQLINNVAPMPTLIAATRGWFGTLLMISCGIAGGYLYARLTRSIHKITRTKG